MHKSTLVRFQSRNLPLLQFQVFPLEVTCASLSKARPMVVLILHHSNGSAAVSNLQLDLADLAAARTVAVAADSIAIIDADDDSSKKAINCRPYD